MKKQFHESEIYGNVTIAGTFDDVLKLAQITEKKDSSLVKMWRGQGNILWPIDSAAYRRLSIKKEKVTEHHVKTYEEYLLKDASHKGYRYIDGRTLSDMELLAKLQHHGAATRLVDATKSILVALWFCVTTEPNKTGLLVGVHAYELGGYEGELDERPYAEVTKGLSKYKYPQTWEPPIVTPRIAAQHSQFLYSHVANMKTGSLRLPDKGGSTLLIAIPARAKIKIKTILEEVFDIRHLTLFPDIDGFGYSNSFRFDDSANYRW